MFDILKTGLEQRGYHQSQVENCTFYRNYLVFSTCVDNCVIVFHEQETTTSLVNSFKNGTEEYMFTDEGDISIFLGVNIKNNLDGKFKLSQSHLVKRIINHVRLTVYESIK